MAKPKTALCPSCGFRNTLPMPNDRCVSCGAKVDELRRTLTHKEQIEQRYQQEGFNFLWFAISLVVMAVLTAAIVMGLPMVVPLFDFEGSAGMTVAIPVWFVGGMLVGLISPGKTFIEPVVSAFLVALPTAFFLYQGQTVKMMPAFMYVLMSALGVLFTLIGSFVGERIQMGPPPRATD
ncbi:MAG: hypothetical protein JW751_15715 [Polyangiaceae bacterium]|nr:hypothetical protein [Polyangiaceae bacterium]